MHSTIMKYWKQYESITNIMFHRFLNGYINKFTSSKLVIDFYSNQLLGVTIYPNTVVVFLGSIMTDAFERYSTCSISNPHNAICSEVLRILCHELSHVDRPCGGTVDYESEYRAIEATADRTANEWIMRNKAPIEQFFNFTFDNEALPARGSGITVNSDLTLFEYYLNIIRGSIIRSYGECYDGIEGLLLSDYSNICISIIWDSAFKRKAYIKRNGHFLADTRPLISIINETVYNFDKYSFTRYLFESDDKQSLEILFDAYEGLIDPIYTKEAPDIKN